MTGGHAYFWYVIVVAVRVKWDHLTISQVASSIGTAGLQLFLCMACHILTGYITVSGIGSIVRLTTVIPTNQMDFFDSSLKAWLTAFWVLSVITQASATALVGMRHSCLLVLCTILDLIAVTG